MDKKDLMKSLIYSIAITFVLVGVMFCITKTSSAIDTSAWPKYAMKKDSVVDQRLIIMCGTTTPPTIVFGTTGAAWVGTPTDSTLATLFLNTATGKMEFKPPGTTTSYPLGSVTVSFLADNYATIASLSDYLQSTGGAGTSNVFRAASLISAILSGSTTVGTDSTITAGGITFGATKVKFLADVTQNIEANIDSKLTKVGTVTTYLGSATAGGKTGTSSISLAEGTDVTITSTVSPQGDLVATFNLSPGAASKPDIQQDGVVKGTQSANIDFKTYFVVTPDGAGIDVSLDQTTFGTQAPAPNVIPRSDANNRLDSWVKGTGNDQFTKLLLHADEVGSFTAVLDSSEQELTVTAIDAVNGTTSQSVFGGASFAFYGIGGNIDFADNPRLELGGYDFMFDLWARFIFYDPTSHPYFIAKTQTPGTDYILFDFDPINYCLSFAQKSSGVFIINTQSGSWTPSLNTWYHIALVRKGAKFRFYVDGSQIGSDIIDSDAIIDNTGTWTIGATAVGAVSGMNGYLDEIRLTIGTGRKSAGTYLIPIEAYGSFTTMLSN